MLAERKPARESRKGSPSSLLCAGCFFFQGVVGQRASFLPGPRKLPPGTWPARMPTASGPRLGAKAPSVSAVHYLRGRPGCVARDQRIRASGGRPRRLATGFRSPNLLCEGEERRTSTRAAHIHVPHVDALRAGCTLRFSQTKRVPDEDSYPKQNIHRVEDQPTQPRLRWAPRRPRWDESNASWLDCVRFAGPRGSSG